MISVKKLLIVFIFFVLPALTLLGKDTFPIKNTVALLDVTEGGEDGTFGVEFIALRRIFDIFGIPYDILSDTEALEEYTIVYTGGALLNNTLPMQRTNDIFNFVEDGGVLVAAGEVGNKYYSLFGLEKYLPGRRRYRLTFTRQDGSLKYIDHPMERAISLGNGERHIYDDVIWSHGYRVSAEAEPLAQFEDGTVGFCLNYYGRGLAYLFGLSFTESVLVPQIGEDYEAQRRYVNAFEPSADVIMLILKAIYESTVTPFVYLSVSPYGKPTSLILSHDVDAQTSFVDSLKYAALEERYGVKSTFFENTKYFVDWMDIDYYNIEENKQAIRELKRRGWDIGSHTVSHYKKLSSAPTGDPEVTFARYNPKNQVTVYGEVRVSKELLDRDIPGQITVSFRAGGLEFPQILIGILEDSGYLYDSTFSANDVLTAFPYRAFKERRPGSPESEVIEIPVTLDDSLGYLTPGSVDAVIAAWTDIVLANMENEAITVLLIHPSDTRKKTYKLEAQEGLIKNIEKAGAWIGDLTTFGEYWRERGEVRFNTFFENKNTLVIQVNKNQADLSPMIGFVVEDTGGIRRVVVKDSKGSLIPFMPEKRNGKLFLGRSIAKDK